MPGGSTHTSLERARKFVAKSRAYFDSRGQLVFLRRRGHGLPGVRAYSGGDALGKDRAVLPPSPEYLAKLGTSRSKRYVSPAEALKQRAVRNRELRGVRAA